MNKTIGFLALLIWLSGPVSGQLGKFMPFVLIVQAPDSITVDPKLVYCIDSMQIGLARSYNKTVEYGDSMLTRYHSKDSLFRRRYIEHEKEILENVKNMKNLESRVRSYKYTYLLAEYSEYEYNSYFNEFPPYSTVASIEGQASQHDTVKAAVAAHADYTVSFKNVRTLNENGIWVLRMTTILYSPKKNKVILEKESVGYLTKDDLYSNRNLLNCLFVSAARSSASEVCKVLGKLRYVNGWFPEEKGSFPILNKTLDLITQVNTIGEKSLYRMLLIRLDSLFDLKVQFGADSGNPVFGGKKFALEDRNDFLKLCKALKPAIEITFINNNMETDYDYYLGDMMVFSFDELSSLSNSEVGLYSNECFRIKVKNGIFSFYDWGQDLDQISFGGGITIAEINSIPVRYLTRGTLMKEIYKNRNGMVRIKLTGEVVQRNVQLKDCNVTKQDGLVYLLDMEGNCYINFGSYIGRKVSNTLHTLLSADCDYIKSIIIDLTQNEGGTLSESMELSNLFLKRGLMMANLTGKDNTAFISLYYNLCSNKPITILVGHKTSGGAEVMAILLKEYRNATIIGEETSGIVSIQQKYRLSQNYIARISIGNFKVADKYDLRKEPIKPDYSYDSPEYKKLNLESFW